MRYITIHTIHENREWPLRFSGCSLVFTPLSFLFGGGSLEFCPHCVVRCNNGGRNIFQFQKTFLSGSDIQWLSLVWNCLKEVFHSFQTCLLLFHTDFHEREVIISSMFCLDIWVFCTFHIENYTPTGWEIRWEIIVYRGFSGCLGIHSVFGTLSLQ